MKRHALYAGLAASLASLLLAGLFCFLVLPAGAALAGPGSSDLAIVKLAAPDRAFPGEPVTFTLAYSNTGTITSTDVLIADIVPISVTALSFSSAGAAITPTGAVSFTWLVADLAPGAGGTITITGVLSDPLRAGAVENSATIKWPTACR